MLQQVNFGLGHAPTLSRFLPLDRRPDTAFRSVYAQAGIPEYWVFNRVDDMLEVYREPIGRLCTCTFCHPGEKLEW